MLLFIKLDDQRNCNFNQHIFGQAAWNSTFPVKKQYISNILPWMQNNTNHSNSVVLSND